MPSISPPLHTVRRTSTAVAVSPVAPVAHTVKVLDLPAIFVPPKNMCRSVVTLSTSAPHPINHRTLLSPNGTGIIAHGTIIV